MSPPWTEQDHVFYSGKIPKGHVQLIVRKLTQLENKGEWIWPEETEKGYREVGKYLSEYLGVKYSKEELKNCVSMLHDRDEIFTKLLARSGISWDSSDNKFTAMDKVWEKLIKKDSRFGWYRHYGEPFWSELGCIFDGWAYWSRLAMGTNDSELQVSGDDPQDLLPLCSSPLDKPDEVHGGGCGPSSPHVSVGSEDSAFLRVKPKFDRN